MTRTERPTNATYALSIVLTIIGAGLIGYALVTHLPK